VRRDDGGGGGPIRRSNVYWIDLVDIVKRKKDGAIWLKMWRIYGDRCQFQSLRYCMECVLVEVTCIRRFVYLYVCLYVWMDSPKRRLYASLHFSGMQIALGADFRFSTRDCQMSIMESRWGLIPDMSASVTLRELVRMDVAKELAMTGRILSGEEGARLGLVTRCVDDPMEEAVKVAREIVERSPDSVAATKALFHTTWVANEETCLQKETDLQWRLIKTYNQMAASGRQLGLSLPYVRRQDWEHEA